MKNNIVLVIKNYSVYSRYLLNKFVFYIGKSNGKFILIIRIFKKIFIINVSRFILQKFKEKFYLKYIRDV